MLYGLAQFFGAAEKGGDFKDVAVARKGRQIEDIGDGELGLQPQVQDAHKLYRFPPRLYVRFPPVFNSTSFWHTDYR